MTDAEKLAILKMNLQLLTNTQDEYLGFLLTAAGAAMSREGITLDDTADCNACQIDYAAYLFRKRAANTNGVNGFAPDGGETAMPRFLRYQLNNILFSQKISGAVEPPDDGQVYLTVSAED